MPQLQRPTHHTGTIIENKKISPTTAHITLSIPEKITFIAGQFCWLTLEEKGETYKRPYSIASAPWEKEFAVCIKEVPRGRVSGKIVALKKRKELHVFTPLGLFTLPKEKKDTLFIAVGTGLAPFRSMIRTLFEQQYNNTGTNTTKNISLLFSARTKEELIYHKEFKKLAQTQENFKYYPTITRENHEGILQGRVQTHLEKVLTKEQSIFVCGVTNMVIEVEKALLEKNIAKENIHIELYG